MWPSGVVRSSRDHCYSLILLVQQPSVFNCTVPTAGRAVTCGYLTQARTSACPSDADSGSVPVGNGGECFWTKAHPIAREQFVSENWWHGFSHFLGNKH